MIGLVVLLSITACKKKTETPIPDPTPKDINLAMGNPSGATSDINSPNNYLLSKPQYTLSYNNSKGTANWVSWRLTTSWLGGIDRQDDFRPDSSLPSQFYHVGQNDFSRRHKILRFF